MVPDPTHPCEILVKRPVEFVPLTPVAISRTFRKEEECRITGDVVTYDRLISKFSHP